MALEEWHIGLILLIVGVSMLVVEAASPGFFIAIPATVLMVLGAIGMAVQGFFWTPWSPIVAVVVAIPATILTMKFYQTLSPPAPPTTTVGHSLVGQIGLVLAPTQPNSIEGKVKIENQVWSATSETFIAQGAIVEVIQSKGVHVVVREVRKT